MYCFFLLGSRSCMNWMNSPVDFVCLSNVNFICHISWFRWSSAFYYLHCNDKEKHLTKLRLNRLSSNYFWFKQHIPACLMHNNMCICRRGLNLLFQTLSRGFKISKWGTLSRSAIKKNLNKIIEILQDKNINILFQTGQWHPQWRRQPNIIVQWRMYNEGFCSSIGDFWGIVPDIWLRESNIMFVQ